MICGRFAKRRAGSAERQERGWYEVARKPKGKGKGKPKQPKPAY